MKFKDFIIQCIAKKMGNKEPQYSSLSDDVNSLLLDFAVEQFNEKSGLELSQLTSDSDIEVTKISELITSKSKLEKIRLLSTIASFIEELSNQNRFFYCVPYDEIYVSETNQIIFNWFEFSNFCISDKFNIPKELLQKYKKILDKNLNSGFINYDILNSGLSKKAFIRFMIYCLYPQIADEALLPMKYWINIAITKLGFTPEEKNFMIKLQTSDKEFSSCVDIIERYDEVLKNSIVNEPPRIEKLKWNYGFHTEQGRNKRSKQNEDTYEFIETSDNQSILFMIADGVTTANIGRGKIVSSRIQEHIADSEKELIDFLMEIAEFSHKEWIVKVKERIVSLLQVINENTTDELNIRLNETKKTLTDYQPMSSTVILGFVNNNRCVFGHLGDSHVFYIENGSILRLNEEHNELSQRVAEFVNENSSKQFEESKSDKHLTKVLPLVVMDEDKEIFKTRNLMDEVSFFEFYPRSDSKLIIATDGLLDCIGSSSNELLSENELLQTIISIEQKSSDLKEIAREIARKADKNSGIDNITLIMLSSHEIKAKDNISKQEKPMIRLS